MKETFKTKDRFSTKLCVHFYVAASSDMVRKLPIGEEHMIY